MCMCVCVSEWWGSNEDSELCPLPPPHLSPSYPDGAVGALTSQPGTHAGHFLGQPPFKRFTPALLVLFIFLTPTHSYSGWKMQLPPWEPP